MVRKICCLLLCLSLIAPCAFAEDQPRRLTEDDPAYAWLYEQSMALAALLQEALQNENYLPQLYPSLQGGEALEQLRMQDFTQPLDVIIVRADRSYRNRASEIEEGLRLIASFGLSPALLDRLENAVYAQTGALLTSQYGDTTQVALSSVLTFGDAWVQPEEVDGPCFTLVFYGGLYALLVTFVPNGHGVVCASARFIPSRAADELNVPVE